MQRSFNWRPWVGFLIIFLAPLTFFALYEKTGAAIWISIALIVLGVVLLWDGVRRSYVQPETYRGKVSGTVLAVVALLIIGGFGFVNYAMHQAYSKGQHSPKVGEKAPLFVAKDATGHEVKLAELLHTSVVGGPQAPRAVLLVFYRGYW
ncbi:MAG: hypothetical protein JOZ10_14190 [Acidobacteria bacterium]|nr:hypothetical protein [Acidobacteriota bacterium]MBV9434538.1 hypothetical protein [Acidobacteriota bacterium]